MTLIANFKIKKKGNCHLHGSFRQDRLHKVRLATAPDTITYSWETRPVPESAYIDDYHRIGSVCSTTFPIERFL